MNGDTAIRNERRDPREQELIWPARQHPNDLVLPDVHPTRFPGRWVAIFEGSIPMDQRNGLYLEGYSMYRITLIGDRKAQVIIREDDRPDRNNELEHGPTLERYEQYDPRAPREYLTTEDDLHEQ